MHAQPDSLSLDQCIGYALAHSTSVQKSEVEAANARADYRSAVASFLPVVGAGVSGQYSWGRNVDPETNTYNTITTFNNYYQLYADMTVFDGGRLLTAYRQARDARRQSLTLIQKARDDKAVEVMQKFVDALYTQSTIVLAEDKLKESRQLLVKVRRQEQLGMKGLPDVAQIEAQVAEDEYNLTHQQNQSLTAMAALRSAMGMATSDKSFRVTSGEPALSHADCGSGNHVFPAISEASLSSLPVALTAEFSVRNARYNYLIARSRLFPTISLSAGVATSYYQNLTSSGPAPSFRSQWKDNMGEYVAATLRIPLFDVAIYKGLRRARNDLRLAELDRAETLRQLHDDAVQALADCEGCAREVVKMQQKVKADSLAWHLSKRKYEEGMLSVFDLRTAANGLLQSRLQLLQRQMMYVVKRKLVDYYNGIKHW